MSIEDLALPLKWPRGQSSWLRDAIQHAESGLAVIAWSDEQAKNAELREAYSFQWAYTRERWICDYFIVSHAARMASNAGNDEIILLFRAHEYNKS